MIEERRIIYPYAFEIKKQCILNIAYMVLKLKKDDMEENKYIKNEYQFVEKNEVLQDVAENIIEKLVDDVIEEATKKNGEKGNERAEENSFWSSISIF